MNRTLAIIGVAALVGTAAAGPKNKKPPDRFAKAASDAFVAAEAADASGDHKTAMGLYVKAFDISPHSSTAYNLADIERRSDDLPEAIEWYEMYLLLAPNAPDAKEVNALIGKLTAMTTILHLKSAAPSSSTSLDLGSAYILLDGEIVKRASDPAAVSTANEPMIDLDSPPRDVTVDVVTAITFATQRCDFYHHGRAYDCQINGAPRVDGSLVIDSNMSTPMNVWEVGKPKVDLVGKRTKITPGKHRFMVLDRNLECTMFTIDIPAGNDIAYVFLHAEITDYRERCRDIDIVQRRLQFK